MPIMRTGNNVANGVINAIHISHISTFSRGDENTREPGHRTDVPYILLYNLKGVRQIAKQSPCHKFEALIILIEELIHMMCRWFRSSNISCCTAVYPRIFERIGKIIKLQEAALGESSRDA